MPVTYNSTTNIISIIGYSEATPCNFTDIYNADVAGSWGVVMMQSASQFSILAKTLQIGDGTTATWFADINKMVIMPYRQSTGWTHIDIKANGNFRSGVLDTNGYGRDGCSFYFASSTGAISATQYWDSLGSLKLYGTYISNYLNSTYGGQINALSGSTIDIRDMTTNRCYVGLFLSSPTSTSVERYTITKPNIGIRSNTTATFLKADIFDPIRTNVFVQAGATLTAKDCYMPQNPSNALWVYTGGGTLNLVNPNRVDYTRNWTVDGNIYYKFELDLKVVDKDDTAIDGARVKIWDVTDALVTNTTTNASGVIATQTIIYYHYTRYTSNAKTPHEMRIYEYGKEMLSSKSSIEAKTDWALTMYDDDHITQTTEATVAAYTGITINHTTETITISTNHTLDEIYDYCQYEIIAATKQLDQTIHTEDGVNFVSEYSFVVNTGVTVTATNQKLSMVSGETYTLTGTAQFTGIIATTTTTRIPITLKNIVDGSRYGVLKSSDDTILFSGTQSGTGDVVGYYEHTANIDVVVRVRKSSSVPKYLFYEGLGTLYAAASTFTISQVEDIIA